MIKAEVKKRISRARAEKLVADYLLKLMHRYEVRVPCEYFSWFGGPCSGLNRVSDVELQEIYRPHIPGVEELAGEPLLEAVIEFERARLGNSSPITCKVPPLFCDGFNRFSNVELPELFPEALAGYEVKD